MVLVNHQWCASLIILFFLDYPTQLLPQYLFIFLQMRLFIPNFLHQQISLSFKCSNIRIVGINDWRVTWMTTLMFPIKILESILNRMLGCALRDIAKTIVIWTEENKSSIVEAESRRGIVALFEGSGRRRRSSLMLVSKHWIANNNNQVENHIDLSTK